MSTVVSGTLRDAKGQLWVNAPIQFIFQPTYGVPGPYTWSGGVLNKMPPAVTTDATGHFTITLPANSEITPASSLWQCAIGPSATLPAVILTLSLIPGALDISTLFGTLANQGLAQSLFVPRAYSDSEVIVPPNSGQLYYDVVAKRLKFYEDGVWNPLAAAGSGMIYPGTGIAVSTGTSWGPSLDPAAIPGVAYLAKPNVFTQPNTFISDSSSGVIAPPSAGLTITNNVLTGYHEVDFINSVSSTEDHGGFNFYNVVQGTTASSASAILVRIGHQDFQVWTHASFHGDTAVDGNIGTAGDAYVAGTSFLSNGHILIGARTGPNLNGQCNILTDQTNLYINSTSGGETYFNWDQNGNGVSFFDGQGGGTRVASINKSGVAGFNGTLSAKGIINAGMLDGTYPSDAPANTYIGRLSLGISGQNAVSYPGLFVFKTKSSPDTTQGRDTLTISAQTAGPDGPSPDLWSISRDGTMRLYDTGIIAFGGVTGVGASKNSIDRLSNQTRFVTLGDNVTYPGGFSFWAWSNDFSVPRKYLDMYQDVNGASALFDTTNLTCTGFIRAVASVRSDGFIQSGTLSDHPISTGLRNYSCYDYNVGIWAVHTSACDGGSRGNHMWGGVGPGGGLEFQEYMRLQPSGLSVVGTITSAGKTFRIPHPLDDKRDLVHTCLEGPEWGVYYRGEVVTKEGSATVVLPNYFEALTYWENRTVQVSQVFDEEDELLTLVAAGRIKDGRFRIRTSAPSAKVAWQVNAIRKFGDSALEIEPLRSNTSLL